MPNTGSVDDVTPWELHPGPLSQKLTGSIQDVTPWELSPPPSNLAPAQILRPIPTGPREDVTPWELQPAPTVEKVKRSSRTRPSTSSSGYIGSSKFPEFGLRRRRSTGTSSRTRPSTAGASPPTAPTTSRSAFATRGVSSTSLATTVSEISNLPPPLSATSSSSTTDYLPSASTAPVPPKRSSARPSTSGSSGGATTKTTETKFSTADRAILEELRANIKAQESHFVLKGVGHTVIGGIKSPGKRYHAFPKELVPYPRSYEREVIDLDVWETMTGQEMRQSLTWHVLEEPPAKVLELGCGTGTWILQSAKVWKDCHFVGLDIVPLHPNLANVGSTDLAARITWAQHNFLDNLPFQDEEFDFVHIKRIALGVPEDKWDHLFEEISRVMKPGGRLEMIEEDLFFPGKPAEEKEEELEEGRSTRRHSISSDHISSILNLNDDAATSTTSHASVPETPHAFVPNNFAKLTTSRASSPARKRSMSEARKDHHTVLNVPPPPLPNQNTPPKSASTKLHKERRNSIPVMFPAYLPNYSNTAQPPPKPPRSAARQPVNPKTGEEMSDEQLKDFETALNTADPSVFGSSMPLLGAMVVTGDVFIEASRHQHSHSHVSTSHTPHQRGRAASVHTNGSGKSPSVDGHGHHPPVPMVPKKARPSPLLLESARPINPRDHTLLEAIWNGMLASRFVNSAPLSVLHPLLEYHFRDVRTHPPLQYSFPPTPPKLRPKLTEDEHEGEEEDHPNHTPELNGDGGHVHAMVQPTRTMSTMSGRSRKSLSLAPPHTDEHGEVTEDHRWVSIQELLSQNSPYVALDKSRVIGLPPTHLPGHTHAGTKRRTGPPSLVLKKPKDIPLVTATTNLLPNRTLNIDLRSLNIHLLLRVREVLACSETMWEWLEEYQAILKSPEMLRERNGSGVGVSSKSAPGTAASRIRSGSLEAALAAATSHGSASYLAISRETQTSLDMTKTALMEMTREDFDQLLIHFELDMQDQASIGTALAERFNWHVFSSPDLQDRKAFDAACEKYEQWVISENKLRLQAAGQHGMHGSLSMPGSGSVTSGLGVPVDSPRSYGRTSMDGASSFGLPSASASTTSIAGSLAGAVEPSVAATPLPVISLVPPQRISRAVRVFVAWKA